eukprot:gb/GECG01003265.1/.p1 GENE.gb/GECG01003265.1/~~gb/GECG01003265.1/.p1  ORF type:complete len:129 (+),score=10.39 gb/GECG01003265.1/:1-387(+)
MRQEEARIFVCSMRPVNKDNGLKALRKVRRATVCALSKMQKGGCELLRGDCSLMKSVLVFISRWRIGTANPEPQPVVSASSPIHFVLYLLDLQQSALAATFCTTISERQEEKLHCNVAREFWNFPSLV